AEANLTRTLSCGRILNVTLEHASAFSADLLIARLTAQPSTTTRLYFRMGVRGPEAPEKPYSVGVRGAAKPPLAPPPWIESGGLRPPDLLTLVVILVRSV